MFWNLSTYMYLTVAGARTLTGLHCPTSSARVRDDQADVLTESRTPDADNHEANVFCN